MWPALLLIPLVAIFRTLLAWHLTDGGAFASWLPGLCPLSAVALCAGAFLPRRLALAVPLSILLASDLVINAHYGEPLFAIAMLGRYALLALIGGSGILLRRGNRTPGFGTTLLATVAASTFFYVASNTLSWASAPEYSKALAGWWQALTTGLPGYLPSWYFYRNALVSDGLYSMVFVACLARDAVRAPQPKPEVPALSAVLPR